VDLDFARPDTLRGPHGAVERVASATSVEDRFDDDGRLTGFLVRKFEDGTRVEVLGTSLVVSGEKSAYLQLRGGKQIEPMLTSKSLSPLGLDPLSIAHLGRMVRRPPRLVTWASAGRGAKMVGF